MEYLILILTAVANMIPLLFGITRVREAANYGAVALLALIVDAAQLLLTLLVGGILAGSATFLGLTWLVRSLENPSAAALLLVAGAIEYLNVFVILAWCYSTFVEPKAA